MQALALLLHGKERGHPHTQSCWRLLFELTNDHTSQWRIQEFQNRGARSRRGRIFLGLEFVLMPLHTYCMFL